GSAPVDGDDLDRLRQALEGLAADARGAIGLSDRREAGDDLAAGREPGDARRLMDALAPEVLADLLRIGGVQPDPHLRREALLLAVIGEAPLDRDRRRDRLLRRVEADEEAVARRRD